MKTPNKKRINNSKINDLAKNTESGQDEFLTTNQGLRINDDQNSLKAGELGATQEMLLNVSEVFDYKLEPKNDGFAGFVCEECGEKTVEGYAE